MENASKALLMAGGVLIAILVITLLIYGWSAYTEYYTTKEELKDIDNLAKFNEQFANYDRDDISGYELISLANKVADYNDRHSNSESSRNDEKYTPITFEIDLKSSDNTVNYRESFSYDGTLRLFKKQIYTQSDTANEIKGEILGNAKAFENIYGGGTEIPSKIAKNIGTLLKDRVGDYYRNIGMSETEIEQKILGDFYKITGVSPSECPNYDTLVNNYIKKDEVYEYYEYYQFKKAIFSCTEINNDDVTGRVSYIKFQFTGKIE